MLSIEKCRKILKQNNVKYNDYEVELVRETMYKLVEIIEKGKEK